jgi:hypothetical protein
VAAPPPGYDPRGFVDTDPATWPQPIPPATLYQPGMAWTMTAAGTVQGQAVKVGDLLFVVHRDRLYGDLLFGDGMFGSTPDQDWTSADVRFVAWDSSAPPENQPPLPYSGCRFGDTGWWIIIDCFYLDATDSRRYGEETFGVGVFGGGTTATARWVDITAGFVDVRIDRGNADGAPRVDVPEITINWYDPDFARFDVAPPAVWFLPFVGKFLRVSFYDPAWVWHPRIVGEIERIVDPSIWPTSDQPRYVTVEAFGPAMDLTRTLPQWQRGAELASTRFSALLTAAGWRYGTGSLTFPSDASLHPDPKPSDVTARDEIDRTALSAGWMFDTDRRGMPRLRTWPLALGPVAAAVVDCADHGPAGLVATLVTFTADESQLLNVVTVSNTLDPPTVVQSIDTASVATYGARDNSLGFPALGLGFATAADGQAIAERVRARYSRIVTHVEPIEADTAVDAGWLAVLADIDTGEHLTVTRVHPETFTLDSIVVGVDETITPARIEATLYTTTTTPTS